MLLMYIQSCTNIGSDTEQTLVNKVRYASPSLHCRARSTLHRRRAFHSMLCHNHDCRYRSCRRNLQLQNLLEKHMQLTERLGTVRQFVSTVQYAYTTDTPSSSAIVNIRFQVIDSVC